MGELEVMVSGLEYKARKLTAKLEQYEDAIRKLQVKQQELLRLLQERELQIRQLEGEKVQMHLSRAIPGGKDAKQVKQKINELVREVDKCIALLNK